MKITLVAADPQPPPIKEVVLRLTEAEALTIRRALYVAHRAYDGRAFDLSAVARTDPDLFRPLADAFRLFKELSDNGVGRY